MARSVFVKIGADISDLKTKLREGGNSVRQFTGELDRAAKGGQLDEVANSAGALGLGLVAAAGVAVKFAADFEKQMSAVSAATHASAQDMDRLRAAALQAGKDTSFSATEAAKGVEELAKAGVSTSAILGGGLRGALDLAAAGGLEVADAAEIAATAMTQFKLDGREVPHVADLLAAAAGKAQGSVTDMAYALKYAGLVSSSLGISVEETAGTLALFASNGLLGEQAGTNLRAVLASLTAPSKESASLIEELGIQVYGANGKFVGMAAVAEQLRVKLGGAAEAQRNMALATIFGREALPAAIALMEAGAKGVQNWTGKVDDAGYAADTAAKKLDNLAGDVERLKGSLETLAIESASGPNQGLRFLAQTADALVGELSSLPPAVGSSLVAIVGIGGAVALLGAGWVKARRSGAAFREELSAIGPTGERAARGMEKATMWAGRAGAAFAVLQVAGALVAKTVGELNPQVEALGKGLAEWGNDSRLAGEAARVLGDDMKDLNVGLKFLADTDNSRRKFGRWGQDLLESVVPGLDSTNTSLTRTRERVTAIDQAFAGLVQAGNAEAAGEAFNRLAESQAANGVSVEELRKLFPAYAAALETATTATTGLAGETGKIPAAAGAAAGATDEYKTAADAAAAAARGQRDALVDLASKLKAEIDPVYGFLEAQNALSEAQRDAGKAAKEHGRNSDEAREANRRLALAAINLQEKTGALATTFNGQLTPQMRATLTAAGLTKQEIRDVATQFRNAKRDGDKFAKKYQGELKLSDPGDVQGKLSRLIVWQQALKKGIVPKGFSGPIKGPDGKYYAEGGWTGPGHKHQPAGVVHADEFVIRKESRKKIEHLSPGALDYMNRYGELPAPGYAQGGIVWPYRVTAARTRVPSQREVADAVMPDFGAWPSSPSSQRGDSGVWRRIAALINDTGPMSGSFGNGYRHGDPKWHGSGRAVDWMGYGQDRLAQFLAGFGPLELIHRTNSRDYAYTRGRNMGSFDNALMESHRNHIHIAMANGGVIREPVYGIGASGNTYSFGENGPETVTPTTWRPAAGGGTTVIQVTIANHGAIGSRLELQTWLADGLDALNRAGRLPATR